MSQTMTALLTQIEQLSSGTLSHIFFSGSDDNTYIHSNGHSKSTMADSSPEIPKSYKAAVYDKPGSISTKITDLETPEPGPGEVLINL
jgi:hypothetical protein